MYPVKVEILTRFSDIDEQRHINNVAVADFYQESRFGFHRSMKSLDFERPRGSRTLVAHHEMDYLSEIEYPGRIWVGIEVSHIGNTSYTLSSGMFQNKQCVGLASTVLAGRQRAAQIRRNVASGAPCRDGVTINIAAIVHQPVRGHRTSPDLPGRPRMNKWWARSPSN